MTAAPVTAASLLDVWARLLQRISELLDAPSRAFLESVEREAPDFNLIGLPHAADLPGVRRKANQPGSALGREARCRLRAARRCPSPSQFDVEPQTRHSSFSGSSPENLLRDLRASHMHVAFSPCLP